MATTTEEAGRLRWKGVPKKQRTEVTRAAVNARWEKWRADHPDKAKASEARRAKRVKASKVVL
ncbi:MAG: hypothetical protein NVS9B4_01230 [Candidatus Acidiferrum sp.]